MTNDQRPKLIALDFDGVICDSVRETGTSGWRAARGLWPDEIASEDPPEDVLDRFIRLRPYLHTGYEAIPLMRLALDGIEPEGLTAGGIEARKAEVLERTGIANEEFLARFSQTRDDWIRRDEDDWLGRNRFYPGTLEALEELRSRHEVFIVTTKQTRFARRLLERAGSEIQAERIFGLDTGKSKETILEELRARPGFRGLPAHFVEDRLPTLRRIERVPSLDDVALHLCDWGYNTPEDRAAAAQDPRIELIGSLMDIEESDGRTGFPG